jgi:hypothetical protein
MHRVLLRLGHRDIVGQARPARQCKYPDPAPLVLRRAYPWAALAASTVAAAVHVVVLADPTAPVVAVPVLVHSLARWSTIGAARAALAVGLIGAVVGPARWLSDRPESPTLTGWVTTIVGYGAVVVAVFVAGRRAREREEQRVQRERQRAVPVDALADT